LTPIGVKWRACSHRLPRVGVTLGGRTAHWGVAGFGAVAVLADAPKPPACRYYAVQQGFPWADHHIAGI
jgi:hypothetical protein